eukprot:TRINITY_DN3993_c0_g2_i1.p1 TRINITY_DN3993_c0_g2~~TRINITY_DN3993_c0_g2_i1.p1  ORF type:complete len:405 (+),score=59.52 TRINITY_DN3993_c0_g2_i1:66-1280(+)
MIALMASVATAVVALKTQCAITERVSFSGQQSGLATVHTLPREKRREICEAMWDRFPDGMATVVVSNWGHVDMAVNALCTLKKSGRDSIIMSLDWKTLDHLTTTNYPSIPCPGGLGPPGKASQRDSRRVALTLMKLRGITFILQWGFTVLCSEADITYLQDPVPYALSSLSGGKYIAFQAEAPFLPNRTEVCKEDAPSSDILGRFGLQCMGLYIARPEDKVVDLLVKGDDVTVKRSIRAMFRTGAFQATYLHEQYGVNAAVKMDNTSWDKVGQLDRCLFAHGHDYFKTKLQFRANVTPVAVHAVAVSPKELYLKQVLWIDSCNGTPSVFPAQASWLGLASQVSSPWGYLWSLLFTRNATKHLQSYKTMYLKKQSWKKGERAEQRKRDRGMLCYWKNKNCTEDEG